MSNIFIKYNVNYNEYFIHEHCYYLLENLSKNKNSKINIYIPKIISYCKNSKILKMQKISGDNISNIYGEDINNIPINIITIIRQCIYLFNQYNIDYIDITGYNFMLDKHEKLWIIDFEHAICRKENEVTNKFLLNFINGELSWNPDFE